MAPTGIGMASGSDKVASIIGAVRAELTDVLVTDERTAEAIHLHLDRQRRRTSQGVNA